jgi:hypothetical protein
MTSEMPAPSQIAAGIAMFILVILLELAQFAWKYADRKRSAIPLPLRTPGLAPFQEQKHEQACG